MLGWTTEGDFKNMEAFLKAMTGDDIYRSLNSYGQEGVNALAAATPRDSGLTANSWSYKVEKSRGSYSIEWINSNTVNGTPVVIMLQYGHGTGTGGYVIGRDFINPAIKPTFDRIASDVWKAVTSA